MQVKILNGNKEAIQRNLDEYQLHLKYAIKKTLKAQLIQTYLMNQINPLREYLTIEDFTSVIGTQECPKIIINIISKLSGTNFKVIFDRRRLLIKSL